MRVCMSAKTIGNNHDQENSLYDLIKFEEEKSVIKVGYHDEAYWDDQMK